MMPYLGLVSLIKSIQGQCTQYQTQYWFLWIAFDCQKNEQGMPEASALGQSSKLLSETKAAGLSKSPDN
jgi:hypothetical protein